jgi:hypothetical protein
VKNTSGTTAVSSRFTSAAQFSRLLGGLGARRPAPYCSTNIVAAGVVSMKLRDLLASVERPACTSISLTVVVVIVRLGHPAKASTQRCMLTLLPRCNIVAIIECLTSHC